MCSRAHIIRKRANYNKEFSGEEINLRASGSGREVGFLFLKCFQNLSTSLHTFIADGTEMFPYVLCLLPSKTLPALLLWHCPKGCHGGTAQRSQALALKSKRMGCCWSGSTTWKSNNIPWNPGWSIMGWSMWRPGIEVCHWVPRWLCGGRGSCITLGNKNWQVTSSASDLPGTPSFLSYLLHVYTRYCEGRGSSGEFPGERTVP